MMSTQRAILTLAFAAAPLAAAAGAGLVPPTPETLWPQWQARISMQTAALSPLSLLSAPQRLDGAAPRVWQGAAVLGDYYFATPWFAGLRASGGLMTGLQGGTPSLTANAGPRLGLSVQAGGNAGLIATEAPGTVPYLGFGFSGAAWRNTLSVTADVGLVAERPSAASGLGRALFGNQAFDSALRELHLAPVLQLGVRYSF